MEVTENQRLKFFRNSLHLTQKRFGEITGLKQGSYADVERGKVKVSGDIKNALLKEFSLNIEWLETGEGDMFLTKGTDLGEIGKIIEDNNEFHSTYNAPYNQKLKQPQQASKHDSGTSEALKDKLIENLLDQVNELKEELAKYKTGGSKKK